MLLFRPALSDQVPQTTPTIALVVPWSFEAAAVGRATFAAVLHSRRHRCLGLDEPRPTT